MPSADILSSNQESIYVGSTTIIDPILLLKVDGIPIAGNLLIQTVGLSKRYIFPRIENGNIYITAISILLGSDLPAITKNIEVFIGEVI